MPTPARDDSPEPSPFDSSSDKSGPSDANRQSLSPSPRSKLDRMGSLPLSKSRLHSLSFKHSWKRKNSSGIEFEMPRLGQYLSVDPEARLRAQIGNHDELHWRDQKVFVEVEQRRREVNSSKSLTFQNKLFLSHSWRDPSTQMRKRKIVSHLTSPAEGDEPAGLLYWADWLDLQAEGPVPWMAEIEEGIQNCSKFVAFIDGAWLTSYNCLQELAIALQYNKPVVALVLDEHAWQLLTVPGGAATAIEIADEALQNNSQPSVPELSPALFSQSSCESTIASRTLSHSTKLKLERHLKHSSEAAYRFSGFGASLCRYNGQEIAQGQVMTRELVEKLFLELSRINLCPCRELEEQASSAAMLSTALRYICRDLRHAKKHSELHSLEMRWQKTGELLGHDQAKEWDAWISSSLDFKTLPAPTKSQIEFVQRSKRKVARSRMFRKATAACFIFLVIAVAVATSVLAVLANSQKNKAEAQSIRAESEAERARFAEGRARASANVARDEAQKARQSEIKAQNSAAIARDEAARAREAERHATALACLATVDDDGSLEVWELKLMNAILDRMTGTPRIDAHAMQLARRQLNSPVLPTRVLSGHTHAVTSLSWHPSGSSLATGSSDNTILIWDMSRSPFTLVTPSPQILEGHTDWVTALAWNADGSYLASGSDDALILIWAKGADGSFVVTHTLGGHDYGITALEWDPLGGSLLASGGHDSTIRLWRVPASPASASSTEARAGAVGPQEVVEGEVAVQIIDDEGHFDRVLSLAWHPDGQRLASGGWDSTIILWPVNASATKPLDTNRTQLLFGHTQDVSSLAFSSTGAYLASGSVYDRTINIWGMGSRDGLPGNVSSGTGLMAEDEPLQVIEDRVPVTRLAWSPTSDVLAAGRGDGTIRLWPAVDGDGLLDEGEVREVVGHKDVCAALAFSPVIGDGRLASGSDDTSVVEWAVTLPLPPTGQGDPSWPSRALPDHGASVSSVAWSPEGHLLATGAYDTYIRLWDVQPNGTVGERPVGIMPGHRSWVTSLSWSPSGGHLASAGDDNAILLWPFSGPKDEAAVVQHLQGHTGAVYSVAWHPSGSYLASGSGDRWVMIWHMNNDTNTMHEISAQQVLGHSDLVSSVAWSPSGDVLASGSFDTTIVLWLVGPDGNLQEEEEHRVVLSGHLDGVTSLAWRPSGGLLASASSDKTVRLWPVDHSSGTVNLEAVQVLLGHSDGVFSVAWSPGGLHLASGSLDNTIRLWPLFGNTTEVHNQAVEVLEGHTGRVFSVAWAVDRPRFASGSDDRTVRLWDIHAEDVAAMRGLYHKSFQWDSWALTEEEIAFNNIPEGLYNFTVLPL